MSSTPAVRAPKTGINDLRRLLEQYKDQIAMALPKHITAERMMRVALTTFSRTPLLAECSATSICGALVQASILGLEPDGMSGEAFLIPYWNTKVNGYECQMQPGYKGIVKLARNTGEYSLIDAQPVHENDTFDFQKGSDTYWVHKWDPRRDRGPVYGYWAGYILKDGGRNFEFMSAAEIEAHRDKYSQGAYKKSRGAFVLDDNGKRILTGPWAESPDWMYRKTPLIQLLKLAPKSYQLRAALAMDGAIDTGVAQQFTDIPKELAAMVPPPEASEEPAQPEPAVDPDAKITEPQVKRLLAVCRQAGMDEPGYQAFLKDQGYSRTADVRRADYERILNAAQGAQR